MTDDDFRWYCSFQQVVMGNAERQILARDSLSAPGFLFETNLQTSHVLQMLPTD